MIIMRENPLHGPLEGVGTGNRDFFWATKWQLAKLKSGNGELRQYSSVPKIPPLCPWRNATDGHFHISCCCFVIGGGGGLGGGGGGG